ncbi:hypothetical protein [Candidatus Poriferisodalis sp.]|uniref:hypothetical protein n=1 Tax=Candidatus Poriferisodalis sp. TaxID=3101277 RepID=UPI003B5275DD
MKKRLIAAAATIAVLMLYPSAASAQTDATTYQPSDNIETVEAFEIVVTYSEFATSASTHNLPPRSWPVSAHRVVPSSFPCEEFSSDDMTAVCNAIQDDELLAHLGLGTAAWWAPQDVMHGDNSFRVTYDGWITADEVLRLTIERL